MLIGKDKSFVKCKKWSRWVSKTTRAFFVSKVYSMMTCVYMHVDSVRDEILDDLDPGQSVIECFIFSVCEVHAPELTWREKKK